MARWDLTRWRNERTSHWLVRTWADGLQQVLSAAGAGGPAADVRIMALPPDPDAWQKWNNPYWISLETDAAAGARLAVGCAAETEQALAAVIGGEGLDAASARQAYAGMIQHATESLAQAALERMKRPVAFSEPAECSLPASASLGVSCHFAIAGESHTVGLAPNEVLLVTLLSEEGGAGPDDEMTALAALPGDAGIIPELALSPHARQNLEMLLDVDLELSVSFGKTTLVLQEVLKLSSGSIVELNRSASDPVELLVNDSVVARGEVVVVDGNYGIRITEVVSPRERIRSLL
ncbi:MAG: flagellar motor switch protein FliN [Bryobacterales bacterium]